ARVVVLMVARVVARVVTLVVALVGQWKYSPSEQCPFCTTATSVPNEPNEPSLVSALSLCPHWTYRTAEEGILVLRSNSSWQVETTRGALHRTTFQIKAETPKWATVFKPIPVALAIWHPYRRI